MPETSRLQLPLSQLYLYLNAGHNLACRVCWVQQSAHLSPAECCQKEPDRQLAYLDEQAALNAINEALPLGLKTVKLTGGEPLLHPAYDRLIDELDRLKLKTIVETSGKGLTAERALRLGSLKGCQVMIGLQGADAATHDRLSAQPGSFETALRAAQTLVKAGIQPQIIFSLVKENAAQIEEAVKLGELLQAGSLRFYLVHPTDAPPGQPFTNGRLYHGLAVEELIALGRRVERDLAPNTALCLLYDQPPAFRGLNPQGSTEIQRPCAVLNVLSVLVNGQYALCGASSLPPELIFGPVGSAPLERIWRENPVLVALREGLPHRLQGICERCTLKANCLGNCALQNYIQTGTFWGPYWFCEAAERSRLFPAGRLAENTVR
jgi:SynChlorMet cassette radical SAM/SPASM protein ScmF